MRDFAKASFSLRESPRFLRLVYAGFLALTLVGLLTQVGFQAGRIGLSPAAIATYYRGDDTGRVMAFPKAFGQLLEVTHAHAFVMAVFFLILAHLFAGTRVGERARHVVLAVAFGGIAGDLAGPWLTRYVSAGFAWLVLVAWIAEGLGLGVLA